MRARGLGVAFGELAAERSEGAPSPGLGASRLGDHHVAPGSQACGAAEVGLPLVADDGVGLVVDDRLPVLSRLLGRTITYRELSFDQDKDTMIRAGVPEQIAEMNAQAFSMIADGDASWLTDDVPSLLGRPARSFEQFAADDAAAFS